MCGNSPLIGPAGETILLLGEKSIARFDSCSSQITPQSAGMCELIEHTGQDLTYDINQFSPIATSDIVGCSGRLSII